MTPERIAEIETYLETDHEGSFSNTAMHDLLAGLRDRDATIERLRESIRTVARVERERLLGSLETHIHEKQFDGVVGARLSASGLLAFIQGIRQEAT